MPNIVDVALHAGVSTATVSRVLSRPERVSPPTRERVLASVKELGYELNVAGRSLRTARSAKLLVAVPDISKSFFSNVIRGAEEAARAQGYAVVLGDTRYDPLLENQYVGMLRRNEVDGLVFLGHCAPDSLSGLIAERGGLAPIVYGCDYSPNHGASSVQIDNVGAGSDAAEHLIGLGHRRIGVVTGSLVSAISRDRLAGVENAMQRHGLVSSLRVQHGDFSVESGGEAANALLDEDVTGIFCFSDEMALGALQAVRSRGLSCPKDISVVGFDDIRFARYMTPALTTIRQPAAEIGRYAVNLLLKAIAGALDTRQIVTLPHQLVVRDSTAPAPTIPASPSGWQIMRGWRAPAGRRRP